MKKRLQSNYDSKYDILYISVIPNEPAIGEEGPDGIVIRRSRKTGEFVGITIFDFKKRISDNDLSGITDFINLDKLREISTNLLN